MGTSVPVHGECSDHLHTVTMLPLTLLLVLPYLLLLPHTQGELCTKQVEELRLQLKVEMEEMFQRREEAMMDELKTELRAELKKEMEAEEEAKKEKCEAGEAATNIENIQHEVSELRKKIQKLEATTKQQMTAVQKSVTSAVSQVRDLPMVMACAYQDSWIKDSAIITYDKLISDYNNHDKPGGGDGVMHISTGQFTCLTAGTYTVTFSGIAWVAPNQTVYIAIYRNGEYVQGSQWHSSNSRDNGGVMYDQGSRTVILHLAVGDNLALKTTTCSGVIQDLVFCVSLTGFDY